MTTAITTRHGFAPQTLTEAMEFSKLLADSMMVPRQYQGKPQDVLVCVQWGQELGLAPMQALQNIAVINGKPSVYGDAAMALVQHSLVCEDIEEYFEHEGTPNPVAVCVAKRKGRKPVVVKFSLEDAKRAGLWGKQGPWTQYPKRMMQMRARGFALRDAFPDILKGLITVEEAQDYPAEAAPKDITPKGNPLDAIAAPEPVDNFVDIPMEVVEPEPVDNLEEANAEAQIAAVEELDEDEIPWRFVVPGKDPVMCQTYEEFASCYEDMCEKVAVNGRMAAETKLEKLKLLHDANAHAFGKMDTQTKIKHIASNGNRRDRIQGVVNGTA